MNLQSLCSICTHHVEKELNLMIYSFRQFHPKVPIYLYVDSYTINNFISDPNIYFSSRLPLSEFDRKGSLNHDNFYNLVMNKMDVMSEALTNHDNTLFVDSDMIFTAHTGDFSDIDIGLSCHNIKKEQEAKYGKYNCGYVFTKNKKFPDWWKTETPKRSKFYEQYTLNYAHETFDIKDLDTNHNFAWFRFSEEHNPYWKYELDNTRLINDVIKQDGGQPIVSFHTHLNNPEKRFENLNNFLVTSLDKSTDKRHNRIYNYADSLRLI